MNKREFKAGDVVSIRPSREFPFRRYGFVSDLQSDDAACVLEPMQELGFWRLWPEWHEKRSLRVIKDVKRIRDPEMRSVLQLFISRRRVVRNG
ncbi:MAG: hypothetical protein HPY55_16040 [Firmicutes bacterium]|nr:hypothetical protein [Bacillota bacterium]